MMILWAKREGGSLLEITVLFFPVHYLATLPNVCKVGTNISIRSTPWSEIFALSMGEGRPRCVIKPTPLNMLLAAQVE